MNIFIHHHTIHSFGVPVTTGPRKHRPRDAQGLVLARFYCGQGTNPRVKIWRNVDAGAVQLWRLS